MEVYAKTPDYIDVLTATLAASNNDTIILPKGKAIWLYQIYTAKNLVFKGNETILINKTGRRRLFKGPSIEIQDIAIQSPPLLR